MLAGDDFVFRFLILAERLVAFVAEAVVRVFFPEATGAGRAVMAWFSLPSIGACTLPVTASVADAESTLGSLRSKRRVFAASTSPSVWCSRRNILGAASNGSRVVGVADLDADVFRRFLVLSSVSTDAGLFPRLFFFTTSRWVFPTEVVLTRSTGMLESGTTIV